MGVLGRGSVEGTTKSGSYSFGSPGPAASTVARSARVGEPGVALLWRARPTEVNMSGTGASSETSTQIPEVGTVDMKLEVVTLPVSDVDRAKRFYQSLGWRLDADFAAGDDVRLVQMTPPHSQCSIHFGKGFTAMKPGSLDRLYLAVEDIDAAREDLIGRGVDVSEVEEQPKPPGFPDFPGRSYFAYASFKDPDGNGWLLQEVTTRLPGRLWED
jgi:catechol 2,3-dioxygenase-like lactoylglutathione lyase family enzyme